MVLFETWDNAILACGVKTEDRPSPRDLRAAGQTVSLSWGGIIP